LLFKIQKSTSSSSSSFKVYHSHTRDVSEFAPVRLNFVPWWALHGFGFFTTRMPFLTVNPFLGSDARWFTDEGGCLHPFCRNLMSPVLSLWISMLWEILVLLYKRNTYKGNWITWYVVWRFCQWYGLKRGRHNCENYCVSTRYI